MNHRITRLILLVSIFMMFTACAHLTAPPESQDALMQRIKMEWEAKVKRDWGVVYDLTVDAYKQKVDRTSFIRRANVNVKEFSIKEVKIIEPRKKALSIVDYMITQMGYDFRGDAKEEWLWENGAWHLNLLPTLQFPIGKKK